MAHWNYKTGKTHYHPAQRWGGGWWSIDCGCSGGLRWGGDVPTECDRCNGSGVFFWHEPSRTFAAYPGGPFRGRGDLSGLEREGGDR